MTGALLSNPWFAPFRTRTLDTREPHDAAGDLAGFQGAERLVDVVDRVLAADKLVELQLARLVEVEQLREVDPRVARAVDRRKDALLGQDEREDSEGELRLA